MNRLRYTWGLFLFAGTPVGVALFSFRYYAVHRYYNWDVEAWAGLSVLVLLTIPFMFVGLGIMRDSLP
jgi:hypothetical protein